MNSFFTTYDKNADGFIDKVEIIELVKYTYPDSITNMPSETEVQEFVDLIDRNQDG